MANHTGPRKGRQPGPARPGSKVVARLTLTNQDRRKLRNQFRDAGMRLLVEAGGDKAVSLWFLLETFIDNKDGLATIGRMNLARRAGVDERTVRRRLDMLKDQGFIEVRVKGLKGSRGTSYQLYGLPAVVRAAAKPAKADIRMNSANLPSSFSQVSQSDAAKLLNVSTRTVTTAAKPAEHKAGGPSDELVAAVRAVLAKRAGRRASLEEMATELSRDGVKVTDDDLFDYFECYSVTGFEVEQVSEIGFDLLWDGSREPADTAEGAPEPPVPPTNDRTPVSGDTAPKPADEWTALSTNSPSRSGGWVDNPVQNNVAGLSTTHGYEVTSQPDGNGNRSRSRPLDATGTGNGAAPSGSKPTPPRPSLGQAVFDLLTRQETGRRLLRPLVAELRTAGYDCTGASIETLPFVEGETDRWGHDEVWLAHKAKRPAF